MKIELKTDAKFFKEIYDNKKNFEIRLGDKKIKQGDVLFLLEVDDGKLIGREIRKKVKFALRTKGFKYWSKEDINKYGFIIVGFD